MRWTRNTHGGPWGTGFGRQGHKKSSGDYWQSLYPVALCGQLQELLAYLVVKVSTVPAWLQRVATPLILQEWMEELKDHPDAEFRGYILNGIKNGFRIGFNRAVTCKPASSNIHSALENVGIVQEYLKKEVSLGPILGRYSAEPVWCYPQIKSAR